MNNEHYYDVFISFSFKDQKQVECIVNQLLNQYGIRYWICTRDIRAGEHYDDKIYEAIKASKVFVLIQSRNSVESEEVPKEIRLAIKFKKTIIPFIIEDSEWVGGIAYQLINTQEIDATRPTLDDRVAELAGEIRSVIGYDTCSSDVADAAQENLISTPNVIPKTIFYGRDNVLNEINTRFESGDRAIFLYGIGGIGKTQIAKQFAKRYRQNYDTVIYATYNGSIKEMIASEVPFALVPEMIKYTLSDGTQESDDSYFKRKLEKIKKLSSDKTLIIIDNFDVDNDIDLPLLLDGRYHMLITTRCDYSRYYPTIKIDPIESIDALKDIFMENYQGYEVEYDDPMLEELIELVNRHTYTIELLAQHMENSGQTAEEMINSLRDRGIMSLNEEVCNSDMKTQIAYENLLKMFKIFSLNEDERQILMYLSLMPIEGINIRDFKNWADLKSLKDINNLEKRSWIIKNINGIALHPIIRSVVKHEIPAIEDNCVGFINRFSDTIEEIHAWHFKKTEKDRYAGVARILLCVFKKITPNTERLYYNSEALFSFAVDAEYAADLAERIYDYYIACEEELSYNVGRSAFKLGWVYIYNNFLPDSINKAKKWLEKADGILGNLDLDTSEKKAKLSQTKVNLAKTHLILFEQTGDQKEYSAAKKYAEFQVEFAERSFKPGDVQYVKVAGAYWQLADVLLAGGELEQALVYIEKALDILISINTENDSDSVAALSRKAAIYYAMGNFADAKPIAKKGAEGYVEFFGEKHPTIVSMYKLLGDCCYELNEFSEARSSYERALEVAEKLFAPKSRQITEIQDCINRT